MKKLIVATLLSVAAAVAYGQEAGQAAKGGVKIQGNTNINAVAGKQTAVAVGEGNVAKNTVGAIKGGTHIKGNTNINAVAGQQTAIAVGKGNKAENAVGQIGGN